MNHVRRLRLGRAGCGVVAAAALAVAIGMLAFGFKPVRADDGEACLITSGGSIKGDANPGWNFIGLTEGMSCFPVRQRVYEALADGNASRANFKDGAVTGISAAGGAPIKEASFRVLFHIDRAQIRHVYANVGREMESVVYQSLAPDARATVGAVYQRYTADQLIGDLTVPQQEVFERLRPLYAARGMALDGILLWRPRFADDFETRISQRANAAIDAQIAQQATLTEIERGKQEFAKTQAASNAAAEKLRIDTEGVANQQRIQAEAARANALIAADQARQVAAINAEAQRVAADAAFYQRQQEAEAVGLDLRARVEAVGGGENYVAIETERARAQATQNWQVSTIMGQGNGAVPVVSVPIPPPPTPTPR